MDLVTQEADDGGKHPSRTKPWNPNKHGGRTVADYGCCAPVLFWGCNNLDNLLFSGGGQLTSEVEDGGRRHPRPRPSSPLLSSPHLDTMWAGGGGAGGSAGLLGSLYRTSRGSGKKVLLPVVDVGCKGGGSTKKLPVFSILL